MRKRSRLPVSPTSCTPVPSELQILQAFLGHPALTIAKLNQNWSSADRSPDHTSSSNLQDY
jgi:hypothetical protein